MGEERTMIVVMVVVVVGVMMVVGIGPNVRSCCQNHL